MCALRQHSIGYLLDSWGSSAVSCSWSGRVSCLREKPRPSSRSGSPTRTRSVSCSTRRSTTVEALNTSGTHAALASRKPPLIPCRRYWPRSWPSAGSATGCADLRERIARSSTLGLCVGPSDRRDQFLVVGMHSQKRMQGHGWPPPLPMGPRLRRPHTPPPSSPGSRLASRWQEGVPRETPRPPRAIVRRAPGAAAGR